MEHLYGAIALLEARAEVREAELARAEHSAMSAASAASTLLRTQYEAALSVKDSALRAAREQVSSLVSHLAEIQGQVVLSGGGKVGGGGEFTRPPGSSPAPLSRAPTPPLYPLFPKPSGAALPPATTA